MGKNYFAVDLGATSGRTILATVDEAGKVNLEEVSRFANPIIQVGKHYHWNLLALYHEILKGLRKVGESGVKIESIGIDTWGVDTAFFGADGTLLAAPISYRDPHTEGEPERFFERIPRREVYQRAGNQVMEFNTLYQLSSLCREGYSPLASCERILFLPDALSYMLTGNPVTEYTIASTSNFLNPRTKTLDADLLQAAGIDPKKFAPIVMPGHVVGTLLPNVQQFTGLGAVPVVAVGGHDTASAVAAVPACTDEFAYLSSGTWSLMGVESPEAIICDESYEENLTNEGGVHGETRFLKNICGMWLLERCRAEWGESATYDALIKESQEAEPFRSLVNPDARDFANPANMPEAIKAYCRATGQPEPETRGAMVRCIFESLALRYRQVMEGLRKLSGKNIKVLHVIGGGSRNKELCQMTSNALGLKVIAGPTECTAMGNVMMQAGLCREQILASVETASYEPQDAEIWKDAYDKFLAVTK